MQHSIPLDASIAWSSVQGNLQPIGRIDQVGVLCGAFDPLHAGHLELNRVASKRLQVPVVYEMSLTNVDKADLSWQQVRRRLTQQFEEPLIVTRAASFLKKCTVFRNCHFVIGADTAERLVDVRYYQQSSGQRDLALKSIAEHGNRFLVGGRFCSLQKRFVSLGEIAIPSSFESLFEGLAESDFRKDLSSTELRQSLQHE